MNEHDAFGPVASGAGSPPGAGCRMMYTERFVPDQAASASKQALKPLILPLFTPTTAKGGSAGNLCTLAVPKGKHCGHDTSKPVAPAV